MDKNGVPIPDKPCDLFRVCDTTAFEKCGPEGQCVVQPQCTEAGICETHECVGVTIVNPPNPNPNIPMLSTTGKVFIALTLSALAFWTLSRRP
jgi:hypothetical protein